MTKIIAIDDEVTITPENVFYLAKSKNPRIDAGLIVTTKLPLPASCWIARIAHAVWIMNAFIQRRGCAGLRIGTSNGRKIVLLRLSARENVGVNIKNLIGFSKGITLRTSVTFSIAAFAIEKNFVHVATGPGLLVFEVSGQPSVETGNEITFHASRLVAWNPQTHFRFDEVHAFVDVYFNEIRATALPGPNGFVLLDADVTKAPRRRNTLWRLIRAVYLPG